MTLTVTQSFEVGGVLKDVTTAKMSDAGAAYGVRRADTLAVVTADGTDAVKTGTGVYAHTFTASAGVSYDYAFEMVYDGDTYRFTGTITAPAAGTKTLADLAAAVADAAPSAAARSTIIVNKALEFMVNLHDWSWRSTSTTLDFVEDEGQILLPADFGRIDAIHPSADTRDWVYAGSLGEVLRLRGTSYNDGRIHYAFAVDSSTPPRRCIEISPLPSDDTSDAAALAYRKLIPVLSSDSDVPAIPLGMFGAMEQLCRAFAVSDEEQQTGQDWALAMEMIAAAWREDQGSASAVSYLESALEDY